MTGPGQRSPEFDPSIADFYTQAPEEDRLAHGPFVLEELGTRDLHRVLKPGGRLFAAGISRWASALDGLCRDLLQDPRFASIVSRDLENGQHRNPTERLDYFTTAYFHRPDELRAEVADAGLIVEGLYGVEGPGWLFPDISERLADPDRRDNLLQVARWLESEPSMLGVSAHLLVVASW